MAKLVSNLPLIWKFLTVFLGMLGTLYFSNRITPNHFSLVFSIVNIVFFVIYHGFVMVLFVTTVKADANPDIKAAMLGLAVILLFFAVLEVFWCNTYSSTLELWLNDLWSLFEHLTGLWIALSAWVLHECARRETALRTALEKCDCNIQKPKLVGVLNEQTTLK